MRHTFVSWHSDGKMAANDFQSGKRRSVALKKPNQTNPKVA
jgi:hypothetical protein